LGGGGGAPPKNFLWSTFSKKCFSFFSFFFFLSTQEFDSNYIHRDLGYLVVTIMFLNLV
jgi:hypothetical protein